MFRSASAIVALAFMLGFVGCSVDTDGDNANADRPNEAERPDRVASNESQDQPDPVDRSPKTDPGRDQTRPDEGPNARYDPETQEVVSGAGATTAGSGDRSVGADVTWEQAKYKTDFDRLAQVLFDRHDKDGDGLMSLADYQSAVSEIRYPSVVADDVSADSAPQPNDETGINAAFENANAKDGQIDLTGFRTAILDRFDMADSNQDDLLDTSEKADFASIMRGVQPEKRNEPPS